MSVDEAVLQTYAAGGDAAHQATLRLYAWDPPTLSLGRGQPATGQQSRRYLRKQGIDLVRRPTGGMAVLHEHELTYAVCGPLRRPPFPGGVLDTYERISAVWLDALRSLGLDARTAGSPPAGAPGEAGAACFGLASVHEITLGSLKLLGSAQLRRRRAFLQHGSLLLRSDPERLALAVGERSAAQARFIDLETALGRPARREELERAVILAAERQFSIRLEPGELSARERECATRLYSWKYSSAAWTLDGAYGKRERHWGPEPLS